MLPTSLILAAVAGICVAREAGRFIGDQLARSHDSGQNWSIVLATGIAAASILLAIVADRSGHLYPWGLGIGLVQLITLVVLIALDLGEPEDPFCRFVNRLLSGVCIAPAAGHLVGLRAVLISPEMPDLQMSAWMLGASALGYALFVWSIIVPKMSVSDIH